MFRRPLGLQVRRRGSNGAARALIACCFLLALAAAGCGGAEVEELPGEEINCAWFDGPNCWRSSLDRFAGRLPGAAASGTLAGDGKRCSYDSGFEVVFVNPIDTGALADPSGLNDFAWDFEARLDGDFLMAYRQTAAEALLLETGAGDLRIESRSAALIITCPEGDRYNVPVAGLLATCPPETVPASVTTWDAQGVTFSLRGTGAADLLLFNCRLP